MDTFFTIYFIVVGGLFILNLIYELIKFFTADGEDWQHELASDVLNWCLELYPIRKQKPLHQSTFIKRLRREINKG